MARLYGVTRDLHLYLGLFISPLVLVFAASVFFLVHAWIPGVSNEVTTRVFDALPISADLDGLTGREQVNLLRPTLDRLGVRGEVGIVRRVPKERSLLISVIIPGREAEVDLNLDTRSAVVREHTTGAWSAMVYLHKMPGQHLANLRGVYLWAVLRAERRVGLALIAAGAASFFGLVYAIVR